jgi:hypothetical protein
MNKWYSILIIVIFVLLSASCSNPRINTEKKLDEGTRLAEWRKGVWLLSDGSYAIYTDTHYFVVMASGDSSSANTIIKGWQENRLSGFGSSRAVSLPGSRKMCSVITPKFL